MRSSRPEPGARLRAWVPRWWRGEGGAAGAVLSGLLWPAEAMYSGIVRARNFAFDRGALRQTATRIPVVSVGNIAVGGAGKTPFTAWVAGRLAGWGRRPAVVLRGYGADEILVHRELNPEVPVFAAHRRAEGVSRAAESGCDVAVLDDAFQHRSVNRDLDVVLVSAESWTAPRRLLPRGPWREGAVALRRADVVVVTRKSASHAAALAVAEELAAWADRVAVCRIAPTHLEPLGSPGEALPVGWVRDREVLAITSLADPAPFVDHLEESGAHVELLAYADHHGFDAEDAGRIVAAARGRPLLMTRKEAVKLRDLLPRDLGALVLAQRVEVEVGADELDRALREALR